MLNKKKLGLLLIGLAVMIILLYVFAFSKNEMVLSSSGYDAYNSINSVGYYGVLKIPKINIDNIIYNKDDINNDVNKNILLVNDDENLIVLAAHSGSSPISYFNKLHKLNINDQIILKIDGRKRVYELFNKDSVVKSGRVNIKKYPYPIIVLITCSKTNANYQEVYYARLILNESFV